MARYFGIGGLRSEANKALTVKHAYKISQFLGWYYDKEHDSKEEGDREQGDREQVDRGHKTCRIVVGEDIRRSSYMLEYVLAAGLAVSDADAYLLHVTTTPSAPYVAWMEESDRGVMISVNHNPYHDNDIKPIDAQGEKMGEDTIPQVEAHLDGISEGTSLAVREWTSRTVGHAAGRNRYTGYFVSLAIRSYENMKVGPDYASGNTRMITRSMFDTLKAPAHVINNGPDGLNINTGCGSTHMEGLIRLVKEKKLDVGFASDGGANRCLRVDEGGNLIDGDLIFYIYGRYMRERGKLAENKTATAAMSNFGLYEALDEAGTEYEKTAMGDRYVYENMALNGRRVGGGQSGHIIFRKYTTIGDDILTAIKMMEVTLEKKQPLSKLAEPVHIYPQALENIRVKNKQVVREDRDVQDAVNRVEQELGAEGRVLVRESGAEPVMRVVVEARNGHKCREYMDRIIRVVVDKGYRDTLF